MDLVETIENYEKNMTIYFRRVNGEIKQIMQSIQNMNIFGDEKEDYELIWDFVVLKRDEYVIHNRDKFVVNINTKQLMLKQSETPSYPIAPISQ